MLEDEDIDAAVAGNEPGDAPGEAADRPIWVFCRDLVLMVLCFVTVLATAVWIKGTQVSW